MHDFNGCRFSTKWLGSNKMDRKVSSWVLRYITMYCKLCFLSLFTKTTTTIKFIYYEKKLVLIVKYIKVGLTIFKGFVIGVLYTFFQRWKTKVDRELIV